MNNRQLLKIAQDIRNAGLSDNKIAKELLSEINALLKNSAVQKKAMIGDPDPLIFKDVFTYWSLAALSELKAQGAVELMTIEIPQPSNGQNIFTYVAEAKEHTGARTVRRRRRERQAPSKGTLANILETIWTNGGQKQFVKQWKGMPSTFQSFYRKEGEGAWERALLKASDWAFAARGHNTSTTATGVDSTRTKVWASVQENTTSTGDLVADTLTAISLGAWGAVKNYLSWKSPEAKLDETSTLEYSMGSKFKRPDQFDREIDQALQEKLNYRHMIEHIAMSMDLTFSEAEEQYARELAEEAKEVAEAEVEANPAQQVDDKEIQDALNNLKALEIELGLLRQMSKLLKEENFHWLFDSHIYLDQWPEFYRRFDADAMSKLDALIKQSGQANIAVAMRALVNITSKDRLKALTHFVENCIDQNLMSGLLVGKVGVGYLIWLCIRANGGFSYRVQGGSRRIEPDTSAFPANAFWTKVRKDIRGITEEEAEDFKSGIKSLLNELAPLKLIKKSKTIDSTLDHIIKMGQKEKNQKSDINALVAGTSGMSFGPKGVFFSVVASEIIRYRYYMDLDMAELSSDPLVPDNLGEPACDNAVRLLIPEMPHQIIDTLKHQVIEENTLPDWGDAVADALDKQIKEEEGLKKKLTAETKKLIEALKKEDSVASKKARFRIARLVRNR